MCSPLRKNDAVGTLAILAYIAYAANNFLALILLNGKVCAAWAIGSRRVALYGVGAWALVTLGKPPPRPPYVAAI